MNTTTLKIIVTGWDYDEDSEFSCHHVLTRPQLVFAPGDDSPGAMGCTLSELVSDFEEEYVACVDWEEDELGGTLGFDIADYDPEGEDLETVCRDLLHRVVQYVRGDST